MAIADKHFDLGAQLPDFIYIIEVGMGIGAALFNEESIARRDAGAGEFGHMTVKTRSALCVRE